ncbi:hypothetical protein quinque_004557 [Culex quinquefasciatus]
MKLFLLLVVLGVGMSSATLRSEVDQLLAFYPMEEVREIYDWWITHAAAPELQGVGAWTEARGVNLRDYLDFVAAMFGWTPLPRAVRNGKARSWASMMEEIRSVTDTPGALALANQFIATPGSEFAELYRMTQDARPAFTRTMNDPEVQRWAAQLRAFGVDIDGTVARLQSFFGWN